MKRIRQLLQYVTKSQFVRAVFFQIISIFLIVILLFVALVSYSFRSEIRQGLLSDQKKQLDVVEESITARMQEVTSIAYNIGQDSTFFLEPVAGIKYSGYEMSNTLSRYLVGNRFIEYLAYYRASEPEHIYTSCGELTFHRFWDSYIDCDNYTEATYLELIKTNLGVRLIPLSAEGKGVTFFTYVCPLPQFSMDPQAFVIALIPQNEISSVLSSQLSNVSGELAIFDASGALIYQESTLELDIPTESPDPHADNAPFYKTVDGKKYAIQSKSSDLNGWSYVSAVRVNGVLSGFGGTQVAVIFVLIALMISAVCIMLIGIISKYRPISNLAMTLADPGASSGGGPIDEKSLLTSTIESLQSDSAEKQQLEVAYQEASEASRAKSTFLSSMSHDIRTPMNAIIGMTGIAKKHIDDPLYVADCLQKVDVASRYLLDIINNVLDMSRIESGKIVLTQEVIDLPAFLRGILTITHTNIVEKRLHLIAEAENVHNEKVLGDAVRLTQVCMNILSNAIKFTPEGGTITLRISQSADARPGYGRYTLRFTDTGIGMSADFVGKVFDTFARADDSGVSKVEGTGLGMAIAKNLVELMDGTITCESALEQGTTFTVTLPMQYASEAPSNARLSAEAACRGMRVLIVGSDASACAHEKALLSSLSMEPALAATAAEALGQIDGLRRQGDAYAFILIHPEKDDPSGLFALRALSQAAPPDTKFVLVAADFMDVNRSAAAEGGVSAFLRAPLFESTVLSMVAGTADAAEPGRGAGQSAVDLTGRRILLVEDNLINREIAHKLISETNAEIEEAENGQKAVEAFAAHDERYFDLILMDVQMPVMNGLEAAARIRSMQRADAATVQIYAMTANTFDEDVREAVRVGMNGHLGKPYTADELYALLSTAIPRA